MFCLPFPKYIIVTDNEIACCCNSLYTYVNTHASRFITSIIQWLHENFRRATDEKIIYLKRNRFTRELCSKFFLIFPANTIAFNACFRLPAYDGVNHLNTYEKNNFLIFLAYDEMLNRFHQRLRDFKLLFVQPENWYKNKHIEHIHLALTKGGGNSCWGEWTGLVLNSMTVNKECVGGTNWHVVVQVGMCLCTTARSRWLAKITAKFDHFYCSLNDKDSSENSGRVLCLIIRSIVFLNYAF